MRPHLTILAAVAACLISAGTRADEVLNIGDPAPKLAVSSWVKGEKVDGFEPGKTYVVEFWATWCGPCRVSIPHLTEQAHKYKDKGVRFIGVDIWENDTSLVKPFVTEMGDKMDYSVALDTIPAAGKPMDGAMAKTWMSAAEEHGIPTAFIIRDGKIAWIGHPIEMDQPLAKVLDGTWDRQAGGQAEAGGKDSREESHGRPEKDLHPLPGRRLPGHALGHRGGDFLRPRARRTVRIDQVPVALQRGRGGRGPGDGREADREVPG